MATIMKIKSILLGIITVAFVVLLAITVPSRAQESKPVDTDDVSITTVPTLVGTTMLPNHHKVFYGKVIISGECYTIFESQSGALVVTQDRP